MADDFDDRWANKSLCDSEITYKQILKLAVWGSSCYICVQCQMVHIYVVESSSQHLYVCIQHSCVFNINVILMRYGTEHEDLMQDVIVQHYSDQHS